MQDALVRQSGFSHAETVADRLERARRRHFIGRTVELDVFRAAVRAAEPPFAVLFVHGPGGVGKTALLDELGACAGEAGISSARVDLRAIEPSPPSFEAALAEVLGLDGEVPVMDALAAGGSRRVLLLDTYEAGAPLDRWLRERFLPALTAGTLVVIAGREPPADDWLADPGWRQLLRVVELRNLAPEEARAYLRSRGVQEVMHDDALRSTHGHPLALSLFVDVLAQRAGPEVGAAGFELADAPDVVRLLLKRFVDEVPSARHRQALEVCAHARFTTEDLLRSAIAGRDIGALFDWLRSLSFVEESASGLFPHDLARDVLDTDLRWRAPDTYMELHRRVRSHVIERVRRGVRATRPRSAAGFGSLARRMQADMADLVFMRRHGRGLSGLVDWAKLGQMHGDRCRPEDRAVLPAMAERHEGQDSAALVAHWLERQREGFVVFRDADGNARAFVTMLALHEATEADLDADPGATAMWLYAQRHGAPRPGEEVFALRFVIDRDDYQGPASITAMALVHPLHVLSHPHAVWDFVGPWADPERIEPAMSYIHFFRAPEADYEVGGRRYRVFAHDWRRMGVEELFDRLGEREFAGEGIDVPEEPAPALALSEEGFADGVRQALRDLHRPDALARNALMGSRAVRDRSRGRPSPGALRDLVGEAVDSLRVDPRDEKLYRALARTYVRPAQTQELAAEALGLPFSTYRRHLYRGIERVTAWLWERELYGADGPPSRT